MCNRHVINFRVSIIKMLKILVGMAEQMTAFLGFCRHSCDVAKRIHYE